ncbi:MAG TPA: hypothetical protein PKH43_04090 [Saprospiraceae bacterium]|nr:hypothetical protein [Saprospiraceae bacterium]
MKKPLICFVICLLPLAGFGQKSRSAEVQTVNGRPVLLVDHQPRLPFFYALTHVTGGRWSWEELPAHNLRQMAGAGVRLFQVDLWLEDLWHENAARLDLALARRQIGGVLEACPEAAVVVRLHVNAPRWWVRRYPEECVQFADGPLDDLPEGLPFNHEDGDPDRSRRASLASVRWQREAAEKTAEFCRRLAPTREGRAVIGIHIAGGVYGEWHSWGFIKHEPDCSTPMQEAFRRWLRDQYADDAGLQQAWNEPGVTLATALVPDTALRRCCAEQDKVLRDPSRERPLLDFYRCQQAVVADDIELFCRTVKQNWPRPLIVGVFYNYLHFGLCRHAVGGHLEAQRLLDCPWIDYFAGPTSYFAESRKAGGSGLERGLVQSVRLHGKLWFDEIDNGYLQNKKEQDFVRSQALGDTLYLPVLQRSLWQPLMQGAGLWLYDFGPRRNAGWWDSPMYRQEISRTLAFFSKNYGQVAQEQPLADVLVVWDADSYYQIENTWTRQCENGQDAAVEDLMRAGAIVDQVYFFDLPRLDLRPYRAVVFANAWALDTAQRRYVREVVQSPGRTVVWNYLAGYSDGSAYGQSLAESLTGFALIRQDNTPSPLKWRSGAFEVETVEKVMPFFSIADPDAEALARWSGPDSLVVMAWKQTQAGAVVCSTVPIHGKAVWRSIFERAGCHIYSRADDYVFGEGPYLLFHSIGKKQGSFDLPGGKKLAYNSARPLTWLYNLDKNNIVLK